MITLGAIAMRGIVQADECRIDFRGHYVDSDLLNLCVNYVNRGYNLETFKSAVEKKGYEYSFNETDESEHIITIENARFTAERSRNLFNGVRHSFKIVFIQCGGTLDVHKDFRNCVKSITFIHSNFTISKDCFKGAPLKELSFATTSIRAAQGCFAELSDLETLKCRLFDFMPAAEEEGKQSKHQVILNAFRGTPIIPQIPENGQNSMISAFKENSVNSFTQTSDFEDKNQGEMKNIIKNLEEKIETLKAEHRQKITNLEQDFRHQKISAKEKYSTQVTNLKKEHNSQIERLKKKLENSNQKLEKTELVQDLKTKISNLEKDINQKEEEKAKLEQKVRTLERKFEKLQNTLRQYIHGGNAGNNLNNNENNNENDAPGANIDAGAAPAI